ncbi:MAG: pyridoxal-phosphate dependent enzyme, partial [Parvularculaceae bacterium]
IGCAFKIRVSSALDRQALPFHHTVGRLCHGLTCAMTRLPNLNEIVATQKRSVGFARRTPTISVQAGNAEVRLKLECLQPFGAFKIRPAAALMTALEGKNLNRGVLTASSGNFGGAVAAMGAKLGAPVTIATAPGAPEAKLKKIRDFGAKIVEVSAEEWWRVVLEHKIDGLDATYVDAVSNSQALAANAAIAIELLEDAPDIDAILVPIGGGGLLCGIAAGVRALGLQIPIIACEVESAAPLKAARAAGRPVDIGADPGFVSGVGAKSVLSDMWPLLEECVDDCVSVSLEEIAAAIRSLATEARIIAEGAGALSYAAVATGKVKARKPACIISGGVIDATALAAIFRNEVPAA